MILDRSYDYDDNNIIMSANFTKATTNVKKKKKKKKKFLNIHSFAVAKTNIHEHSNVYLVYISHTPTHMHYVM